VKKFLLGLPLAAVVLSHAAPASADPWIVNVGNIDYTLTITDFQTQANFFSSVGLPSDTTSVPWFNNNTLASSLATGLGGDTSIAQSYADPNQGVLDLGPLFAVNSGNGFNFFALDINSNTVSSFVFDGINILDSYVWVQGSAVVPTPGPLPLLGAAAAFRTSRKLRRKISASTFKL